MKLRNPEPEAREADRADRGKRRAPVRRALPPLPVEWMDPLSWRLPSGKALAEFALQSGFLAPLLLGSPARPRRHVQPREEGPASTGRFRAEEAGGRSAGGRQECCERS
jgi:hypothetical protein